MERDTIKDLILPNSVFLLEEKLTQLLNIHVYLHEESSNNTSHVRDIRNDVVKKSVLQLGYLLYQIYIKDLRTWETTHTPTVGALYESKQLLNVTIRNTILLVVRTIKPYFEHGTGNAIQIFVNYLLQDSANKGISVERWKPLLLALYARGKFPFLLNRLMDCMCNENSETNINAAEWTIFLLKSLLKRYKVQKKLDLISSSSIPSSKRIKLHLTEREKTFLTKDRIKQQLSVETGTHESNDVLSQLFEVIERKNRSLQFTLQLQDAKFLTEQEIYQLVQKVFLVPNTSTQVISELLLNMSNRLNKSAVVTLLDLMKLKSNRLIDSPKNNLHVFDSSSLARCLLPEIQARSLSKIAYVFQ